MPEILETKNCVVAFLDLLGTSAAIMNDEHDSNLCSMNHIWIRNYLERGLSDATGCNG